MSHQGLPTWMSRIVLLILLVDLEAFTTVSRRTACKQPTLLLSWASRATDPVLGGVSDFDSWFQGLGKAVCDPSVKHTAFGCLRGLTLLGNKLDDKRSVVKIPKSAVLQSSYGDEDWDVKLAENLWEECLKGPKSEIYGYCSLLLRGMSPDSLSAVSTAPNALRHWSASQKEMLATSPRGKKLMDLQAQQEKKWRDKYDDAKRKMTWEQFEWCMEVVHSRAFRGNYGGSMIRNAYALLAPMVAAFGFYRPLTVEKDMPLAIGLVLLAVSPFLVNFAFPDKGEAVLLPLIDSANHLEEADSSIEFNPLEGTFSLAVGPKCLVQESDQQSQLYISYGSKSYPELMLNYGFLPGIPCSDGEDEQARDSQRKLLAAAFLNKKE